MPVTIDALTARMKAVMSIVGSIFLPQPITSFPILQKQHVWQREVLAMKILGSITSYFIRTMVLFTSLSPNIANVWWRNLRYATPRYSYNATTESFRGSGLSVRRTRNGDVLMMLTVVYSPSVVFTLGNISLTTSALNIIQPDLAWSTSICVADKLAYVSDTKQWKTSVSNDTNNNWGEL